MSRFSTAILDLGLLIVFFIFIYPVFIMVTDLINIQIRWVNVCVCVYVELICDA